jgi:hypothetical protein
MQYPPMHAHNLWQLPRKSPTMSEIRQREIWRLQEEHASRLRPLWMSPDERDKVNAWMVSEVERLLNRWRREDGEAERWRDAALAHADYGRQFDIGNRDYGQANTA